MLLLSLLLACGPKKDTTTAQAAVPTPVAETEPTSIKEDSPDQKQPLSDDWISRLPAEGSVHNVISVGEQPAKSLVFVATPQADVPYLLEFKTVITINDPMVGQIEQDFVLLMNMIAAITDVQEDGTYSTSMAYDKMEATSSDPNLAISIEQGLQLLDGIRILAENEPNGSILSQRYDIPDGADPSVQAVLENSSSSMSQTGFGGFPTEAIGVGAQWEILSVTNNQGMEVVQRALCTLTSFDGQKGTMKADIEQALSPTAANDNIIEEFQSIGNLEFNFDLNSPLYSTLLLEMDTSFGTNNNGMKQQIDMNIQIVGSNPE